MHKKLILCLVIVLVLIGALYFGIVAPNRTTDAGAVTYTGSGQGYHPLKVTATLTDGAITHIRITHKESSDIGAVLIKGLLKADAFTGLTSADDFAELDAVSSATCRMTVDGLYAALADVFLQANGAADALSFTPGTYHASAHGYNGMSEFAVTFSENAMTSIDVVSSTETAHVGDVAFAPMIADMIAANGSGVDAVSGATVSSSALRAAVNDAAEQAGCTSMAVFRTNTVAHLPEEPIEETYDIVVVGGGGAGIAAAAQAAQDGNTVLVIERNAEVGGNTLVSGGQYQSVMPYLVWDPEDPDATTGVGFDGNTYDKVTESITTLEELKNILNWSEEPFDTEFYKDHEFVAGDTVELAKHGVHEEYLPTLLALKDEIRAYLAWAEPKVAAGAGELTLFSTINLHIFQTYYGGLRPSADMSEWIYGDFDLVSQFIRDGQELKPWLEAQGATFEEDTQPTLIGALWYRENQFIGAEIDGEVYGGRWGTYFKAPMNTLLKTSATADANKILTRTTAEELIMEDGRVTGVKATRYDGTPVTAYANKGVILATGGYAANNEMVLDTNIYWSDAYLSADTKTTNRSSLVGQGITMAQAVGADVTGMGFAQVMPNCWIDDGNLAFGGPNYVIFINLTTGERCVDENSERDVLSLAEFRNGIEMNGVRGVYMEIANAEHPVTGPYIYGEEDVTWRQYVRTVEEFEALFASLGLETDAAKIIETIRTYDAAVMAGTASELPVRKTNPDRLIGNAEKDETGKYIPETYVLDGVPLRIRFMAPAIHHTMGGLKVDVDRHVLSTDGTVIPGLYAAGEVTGGIHGGNRLGGNAIVEIFVSGRTAAKAANADANK